MATPLGNRHLFGTGTGLATREGATVSLKPTGTNDQAAVRAAIDSLASVSAGGEVVLEAGDWSFEGVGASSEESVAIPYALWIDGADPPVTIRGQGRGATRVKLAAGEAPDVAMVLVRGTAAANRGEPTRIVGLTVDGNAANLGAGTPAWANVTVARADDVAIEDVEVKNSPEVNVVVYLDSRFCCVRRCVLRQTDGQESVLRVESPNNAILDNRIVGLPAGGAGVPFAMLSLNNNTDIGQWARNCVVRGNYLTGGRIQMALGGVDRNLVLGNHFLDVADASGEGLRLTANFLTDGWWTENNLIQGNAFGNVRHGIRIANGGSSPAVGTRNNLLIGNLFIEGPDADFGNAIVELGSTNTDWNLAIDNLFVGTLASVSMQGANSIAGSRGNRYLSAAGAITLRDENSGTATVANGATTAVVTHGLGWTPAAGQVVVWPTNSMGNATKYFVGTYTSTQFTITVNADPGAGTATFGWRAMRG